MEQFKLFLFTIISVSFLFGAGYWALKNIETGSEHATTQKARILEKENNLLKKELEGLKNYSYNDDFEQKEKELVLDLEKKEESTKETVFVYKHQSLLADLQSTLDKNVLIKLKSKGPDVGFVQKFLNIYYNKNFRIDNDFGLKTKDLILDFQKKNNLTQNGEVDSNTLIKMIEWLRSQG